jgi:hypothetical protein
MKSPHLGHLAYEKNNHSSLFIGELIKIESAVSNQSIGNYATELD